MGMNTLRNGFCLSMMLLILSIGQAAGEQLQFKDRDTCVTRQALNLAIFDMKISYIDKVFKEHYPFLEEIQSFSVADSVILCEAKINLNRMKGSAGEKQVLVKDMCQDLFRAYQSKFPMVGVKDNLKLSRGLVKSIELKEMGPCHLRVRVKDEDRNSPLADWNCGEIKFSSDFK